jgi:hypothetical protein
VGDIQYKDVSDGYLELTANFASEEPGLPGPSLVLRASDDIGPLARLRGSTPDWTPFWLPFDSSQQKSRLTSLVVNLNLADRGNVYLRNVRLVQYPDGTFPKSLAPSGTIPPPQPLYPAAVGEATRPASPGIDWKSFLLGAATTGLALLAVTGLIFVSRLWQRRHHERELRRIASLDS